MVIFLVLYLFIIKKIIIFDYKVIKKLKLITMKYVGSKNRIAKQILPIILKNRKDG